MAVRRVTENKVTAKHPFSTRAGRKVRNAYADEHPICEPCARRGVVVEMFEVHHIVPVSEGGSPYDWDNLESRCEPCHNNAHGKRVKGCAADGTPLDPDHPWNNSE
jgi:5-methylcytosine-specific restriction endonuclease McrA